MKKGIILLGLFVLLAGGATAQWFPQNSTLSYTLYDVDFVDTLHGVVTGIDTQHSDTGLVTTNGGTNWIRTIKPGGFGPVCMVNNLRGFSSANTWVTTRDGGFTWNTLGPLGMYVYGLSFVDTLHGWAVGNDAGSYIKATTDGGLTWTDQATNIKAYMFDVCFVDTLHGWAAGYDGGSDTLSVVATRDGGVTWVKQKTRGMAPAQSVFFLDTLRGWVAGSNSTMRTTNGGQTWNPDSTITFLWLLDIVFADSLYGWAVGQQGANPPKIVVSTDGGWHWIDQTPSTTSGFGAVDFVGRRKGWAVGANGIIYHTDNGGGIVGVEKQPEGPDKRHRDFASLNSILARPNPSKGAIWLRIRVPEASLKNTESRLRIYDMSGRLVRDLTQVLRQGHQEEVLWDGRDEKGKAVPSGTYLVKLKAGDKEQERKVVVVR